MNLAFLGLALALQSMPQSDLIFRGENVGRFSAAAGACEAIGYEIDEDVGVGLIEQFRKAALAAGWTEETAAAAVSAGAALHQSEMELAEPPEGASDADLRRYAVTMFARFKEQCHDLERRYPGVIVDLERGDRNADARLAIMLRPLDD